MNDTHLSPTPGPASGHPSSALSSGQQPRSAPRMDLRLVLGLALLTLAHPVVALVTQLLGANTTTVMAAVGTWLLPAIAVTWIVVVWIIRAARPVATLALTGATGGLLYALMVACIQWAYAGSPILLSSPAAMVGLVALNALAGLVCGLIAWALQAATGPRRS